MLPKWHRTHSLHLPAGLSLRSLSLLHSSIYSCAPHLHLCRMAAVSPQQTPHHRFCILAGKMGGTIFNQQIIRIPTSWVPCTSLEPEQGYVTASMSKGTLCFPTKVGCALQGQEMCGSQENGTGVYHFFLLLSLLLSMTWSACFSRRRKRKTLFSFGFWKTTKYAYNKNIHD